MGTVTRTGTITSMPAFTQDAIERMAQAIAREMIRIARPQIEAEIGGTK